MFKFLDDGAASAVSNAMASVKRYMRYGYCQKGEKWYRAQGRVEIREKLQVWAVRLE